MIKEINLLLEEAQSQLTLYNTGQDDYAYKRYEIIMNQVRELRKGLQHKTYEQKTNRS
tara:strand:- start:1784 stop:1957 length:174 start_codon:yes stop_codon:yes gene_type:complete